jgi:hypothetical protein
MRLLRVANFIFLTTTYKTAAIIIKSEILKNNKRDEVKDKIVASARI